MVSRKTNDVAAVYSSQDRVMRFLPPDSIAPTSDSTPTYGKVLVTDLAKMIREWSRTFDGKTGRVGLAVPFPDITASNPSTPSQAIDYVTSAVVGEVRDIISLGNRKEGDVSFRGRAEKIVKEILDDPNSIGVGQVRDPELLTKLAPTDEYGKMFANTYRLRNLNLIGESLRFVDVNGKEVFRTDGFPFSQALGDYAVISQSKSIIFLGNESAILSAVGVGGGVTYDVSWRHLDWGTCHEEPLHGVQVG